MLWPTTTGVLLAIRMATWMERSPITQTPSDLAYRIDARNRGVVRADKGDLDGAIADFTEAIRLYPQTPQPT